MGKFKITRIARELVAAENDNVLSDYYMYYESAKWMIQTTRAIVRILRQMSEDIASYQSVLPKLEENIGYVAQEKMSDMNTSEAAKEMKKICSEMKKEHSAWEKETSGEKKAPLLEKYLDSVNKLLDYAESYSDSCENSLRIRHSEDERNVSSLLETIRDAYVVLQSDNQN